MYIYRCSMNYLYLGLWSEHVIFLCSGQNTLEFRTRDNTFWIIYVTFELLMCNLCRLFLICFILCIQHFCRVESKDVSRTLMLYICIRTLKHMICVGSGCVISWSVEGCEGERSGDHPWITSVSRQVWSRTCGQGDWWDITDACRTGRYTVILTETVLMIERGRSNKICSWTVLLRWQVSLSQVYDSSSIVCSASSSSSF